MNPEKQELPDAAPARTGEPSGTPSAAQAASAPGAALLVALRPSNPATGRSDPAVLRNPDDCPDGYIQHPTKKNSWLNPTTGKEWLKYLRAKGFRKGQSGNPKGRPKKEKCLPDLLRWAGAHKCPADLMAKMQKTFGLKLKGAGLTVDQAIALRVCLEALNGDVQAIRYIADRTEGKAVDHLVVDNKDAGPLVQVIVAPGRAPEPGK